MVIQNGGGFSTPLSTFPPPSRDDISEANQRILVSFIECIVLCMKVEVISEQSWEARRCGKIYNLVDSWVNHAEMAEHIELVLKYSSRLCDEVTWFL